MDLQELFLNMFTNNKIGHAYLIGNIKYEKVKKDLNSIFSKYIFNNEEIENDPDLYLISPENLNITKEQIKNLQEELHKTSQYHNKKIYVISECEKLNPYAANSLLKILEEPSKDIYAFLLTENINKVMETIKSRCQILFISSQIENFEIQNIESEDKIMNFIEIIEEKKEHSIAYYNKIISSFIEKKDIKNLLISVEYFYRDCINFKTNRNYEYYNSDNKLIEKISDKNEINKLTKKLLIVNNAINKLDYNLNISLLMDKILIELGRC